MRNYKKLVKGYTFNQLLVIYICHIIENYFVLFQAKDYLLIIKFKKLKDRNKKHFATKTFQRPYTSNKCHN